MPKVLLHVHYPKPVSYTHLDVYKRQVVDENGDPLPAAHIRQVSQTKGEELAAVITDMNGHFRLTLLRTAKEIEISYLGYESKKVRLTSANSYRIVLEPASEPVSYTHLDVYKRQPLFK